MDPNTFSKLPFFLRLHGSVLPKMLLSLLFVASWATAITCISKFVWPLGVNSCKPPDDHQTKSSVLLTILGFVVGLALSFRSSTAYERYAEGRRYFLEECFLNLTGTGLH
jgi:ion channel-forming bestrophin family protein